MILYVARLIGKVIYLIPSAQSLKVSTLKLARKQCEICDRG